MTTVSQDPAGRYTILIEEWRRIAAERNAGPVVSLLYELVTRILIYCASRAEQARTAGIADTAPARAPATLPEASPRQSGAPVQREPEDACGDGMMHEPSEQPKMQEPIAEAPRVGDIVPLPRPARVRKSKDSSAPPPARPLHANHAGWPRWRGAWMLRNAGAGFLRFNSKKWVRAGGDSFVDFVTI